MICENFFPLYLFLRAPGMLFLKLLGNDSMMQKSQYRCNVLDPEFFVPTLSLPPFPDPAPFQCPGSSARPAHSRSLKNRRIASIDASRIVSCPLSHLSTVDTDTPSSREIRAFFHFDRSANLLKRSRTSAFSRSLRSFWVPSIVRPLNDAR